MGPGSTETFAEFWRYYLAQHSRPATRWLHFAGTSGALACLAAGAMWRWWPAVLLGLVLGYGCAFLSHWIVEHNQPASFRRPVWSLLCDLRMWGLMLTNSMPAVEAPALNLVAAHALPRAANDRESPVAD